MSFGCHKQFHGNKCYIVHELAALKSPALLFFTESLPIHIHHHYLMQKQVTGRVNFSTDRSGC